MKNFNEVVVALAAQLSNAKIPYQFTNSTSLKLQGVSLPESKKIDIVFQWDFLDATYTLFLNNNPSEVHKNESEATFHFFEQELKVSFTCLFNQTVKTDPYRIMVNLEGNELWCQSLYSYLYSRKSEFEEEIHTFLREKQLEMSVENESAWNQNNYLALVNRHGNAVEVAKKIKDNPKWRLHPFYKYLHDVSDKKIIHLMGSNGIKAVALAILGGQVSVVDFSKENERFAKEIAREAGVSLQYIVSDVLSLPQEMQNGSHDIVLMELGVLHYFIDLSPLAKIVNQLLKENGVYILHEFHPLSTKLITSTGKKHKITGDYFDPSIKESNVAFTKHMPTEEQNSLAGVYQRHWTLGEIITTFAKQGLYVEVLEEEPNHKLHDIGLPKTFTLLARKHK
ncbi:class I SAM-dependent methyltransferase [Cytobacillus sp. S13-E01]|uniref:class I SAM-dependent methyltransferase n=1 Tax=Cytobacillus sp. S13-E01 TaxID=3031326 RepID=UPI0023D85E4E|nr:class I SAM-dependent methyltransferase [Cytobacillus sp. S13-E01]MDF0727676.1 class I SAM-dependent methyltransferase [Cytobacillus sp. S13-E01]